MRPRPYCVPRSGGWAAYGIAWFDAHLWAYAEEYGLSELISEDLQHDRLSGTVRAINPFR